MIVCEFDPGWTHADPDDPRIGLMEVDVYANDFSAPPSENHRLSIRRVMADGSFELYRHYHFKRPDQVVVRGSLHVVLRAAQDAWMGSSWGKAGTRTPDEICDHVPGSPGRSRSCGKPEA
jgi:hypothetical protein